MFRNKMRIGNLPFEKLNEKEREVVKKHFEECMKDKSMNCHKLHKNINDFWESHKTEDTQNGNYDWRKNE